MTSKKPSKLECKTKKVASKETRKQIVKTNQSVDLEEKRDKGALFPWYSPFRINILTGDCVWGYKQTVCLQRCEFLSRYLLPHTNTGDMLAWRIVATQMYQQHPKVAPNHGIHRPDGDEITQRFWWRVGSSPCNRSSIYLEGGILNGLPRFSTNTAMT